MRPPFINVNILIVPLTLDARCPAMRNGKLLNNLFRRGVF